MAKDALIFHFYFLIFQSRGFALLTSFVRTFALQSCVQNRLEGCKKNMRSRISHSLRQRFFCCYRSDHNQSNVTFFTAPLQRRKVRCSSTFNFSPSRRKSKKALANCHCIFKTCIKISNESFVCQSCEQAKTLVVGWRSNPAYYFCC